MSDREAIRVLTADECRQRVAEATLGRLAWVDDAGTVVVIPVNFTSRGGDIFIRTTEHLANRISGRALAVQLDEIEPAVHAGWSVLVQGTGQPVDNPDEALAGTPLPPPWAGGERHVVVRIHPTALTGRTIDVRPGGVAVLHLGEDDLP